MIPANTAPSNWNVESLKEHMDDKVHALDEKLDNYDRRYEEKFNGQQVAVKDALAAQEKASQKTESAQREYNLSHNDLLRKMEAMVPLTEYKSGVKTIEDIISVGESNTEKRIDRMESDIRILRESKSGIEGKNSSMEQMAADVRTLLLSRSETGGQVKGVDNTWKVIFAVIGAIGTIVLIINAFLLYSNKK